MAAELNKKRGKLKKKLSYLKNKMAKFFDCNEDSIKFSNPDYSKKRAKINVEIMLINRVVTSLKKFSMTIYYFDFEIEDNKKENIWYEGNFYGYENISEFFNKIYVDIKKLDEKSA